MVRKCRAPIGGPIIARVICCLVLPFSFSFLTPVELQNTRMLSTWPAFFVQNKSTQFRAVLREGNKQIKELAR
uniref:Uncharacterized protein n=1 Tax=Anopheles atroparvus TaxID=41427 RepID=A0AAG5DDR7_ANOAO